jgi:hypothetical protein
MMIADNRRKPAQSSRPSPRRPGPPAALVGPAAVRRASGQVDAIPSSAGAASNGAARSPPTISTGLASTGASANPTLPPRENQLIPMWPPPLTEQASRAASGWYAATPRPESAITAQVAG